MSAEFALPKLNRIHIAWEDALLKPTSETDLEFTLPADVDRIFEALEASGKNKVALYVHGGLVSGESEFGKLPFHKNPENKILFDALNEKMVYPIYFVWETGVKESLKSVAKDWGDELAEEPILFLKERMAGVIQTFLFKRILKYLPKIVTNKARIVGQGLTGSPELPEIQEAEIEKNKDHLSFYEPASVHYDDFDEQDQQAFLEKLSDDQEFMDYLRELGGAGGMGLAPHPDIEALNAGAGELMGMIREDVEGVTGTAQASLVERPGTGLVGVVVLEKIGKFLGQLALAVGMRFAKKENHGVAATITEEFLRLVKLNRLGILIWEQMKQNAREAYLSNSVNGIPHGGYYLLQKLAEYLEAHPETEVSLIGHSAGSIHLSHLVATADTLFGQSSSEFVRNFKFNNLIFLAPAVNFETFQDAVNHKQRFKRFHIFTMRESDELHASLLAGFSKKEKVDEFLRAVYPCSLLYAVSGLAEAKDKGDVPILGLARHLDRTIYHGSDILVRNTQGSIEAWPAMINWSHNLVLHGMQDDEIEKQAAAGRFSASLRHGDFDNEPWTALSVASLL